MSKFYLFIAAAQGGLLWLVLLAVVNSLISLYYYLMVIKQAYLGQPSEPAHSLDVGVYLLPEVEMPAAAVAAPAVRGGAPEDIAETTWRVAPTLQALALALFVALVVLGVYPGPLVNVIESVGKGLFGG